MRREAEEFVKAGKLEEAAAAEGLAEKHEVEADRLWALRARVKAESMREVPAPVGMPRGPGRNEPCPCGSGRKAKKCHGSA